MSASQVSQTAQEMDHSLDNRDDVIENKPIRPSMGFQLRPRLDEMINGPLIKKVMQNVYGQHLDGKMWTDLDPKITCGSISRDIEYGVIDVYPCIREDHRYKLVVQTVISECNSQSINILARCLFDKNTDRLVHDEYINDYVICNSQVYFSYYC